MGDSRFRFPTILYRNILTVSTKKSLEPRYNKIQSINRYTVPIVLDNDEMCHKVRASFSSEATRLSGVASRVAEVEGVHPFLKV